MDLVVIDDGHNGLVIVRICVDQTETFGWVQRTYQFQFIQFMTTSNKLRNGINISY